MSRLKSVVAREVTEKFNEKGPWQVDHWTSNDDIVIQSHDTHDVALVVDGNFGSLRQKYEYALELCAKMNFLFKS